MLRESLILIRSKIAVDLFFVGTIVAIVQSNFAHTRLFLSLPSFLIVVFANMVTWHWCAKAFGLYKDFRQIPFSVEWVIFLKAFALYALVTSFIAFQVFGSYPYGKHQVLLQCAIIFFMLPMQKVAIRVLFKKIRNSNNVQRKVLIVGAGKTGLDFYQNYVRNKHYGYQLTGFVDDQKQPLLNGHYLGKTADIDHVITQHELDDIIVALPITQETQIQNIVAIAERQGKRVRIIHNIDQYAHGRIQVDRMGGLSMITLRSLPLDNIDNKLYKRAFDMVFSLLVLLCICSWLFPVIAIIIKLTSKGPVFFKQDRWGLNNQNIKCFKFRTMVTASTDTDAGGKYRQACKDDPRITPIGRFLRKTSMDELPQFFNVLIGSMSVVGPRPHPVPLNMESKDSIESYMMRHWVKPGISGWAQVHGFRGETKEPALMKQRIKHDLWYIENWTFWLDLQIILQTVVNAVKGEENAY